MQTVVRSVRVRDASIEFAEKTWSVRHHVTIELHDAKPALSNQVADRAVHIATATDYFLKRIKEVLALCDSRVVASAVLEKRY